MIEKWYKITMDGDLRVVQYLYSRSTRKFLCEKKFRSRGEMYLFLELDIFPHGYTEVK